MNHSDRNLNQFNTVAGRKTRKREAPFSLRLTFEERAQLKKMAGDMPLGAFIKAVLFDGGPHHVRRGGKKGRIKDDEALARVLAALGGSRLSSNLNQLARAVNTGTLPVTPETEADLKDACESVITMRQDLMQALGLRGGS